MKQETLKDWIKRWSIKDIVGNLISLGMEFQASQRMTGEELGREKQIFIREITRRIKGKIL